MYKHLVTSGCSFSDNEYGNRWPHFLADKLNLTLYNRGQGSAGNDWISMSTIYQIDSLLKQNIPPEDIVVAVMWSGIDRGSIFMSKKETPGFETYSNDRGENPVGFWDSEPNKQQKITDKGFLLGSPRCGWNNKNIIELKNLHAQYFYNEEWQVINSLNHWLQLQWFCKLHNIKLLNMTFVNIFHFPHYPYESWNKLKLNNPLPQKFYQTYSKTTKYLFDMLDMNNWWFDGDNFDGMNEWTIKRGYPLYPNSDLHPAIESHEKFTDEVLVPLMTNL